MKGPFGVLFFLPVWTVLFDNSIDSSRHGNEGALEMDVLKDIRKREGDIYRLEEILALLSWDQETGMPEKALEDRSDQMAWIQQELSDRLADPDWENLIAKLGSRPEEEAWKKNLFRRYRINSCLPRDFMSEYVRVTSLARNAWQKARVEEDFSLFLPHLEKVVELSRDRAGYLGYENEPYDALLDLYEPGVNAEKLGNLFGPLHKNLAPLIDEILEKQGRERGGSFIFDTTLQKKLHLNLLGVMGYDLKKGRMDFSVHPFTTTLGTQDVRITTHLDSQDFFNGLFSTIHEAGHGLYEQNLPSLWKRTVNGQACSLGIHESQSRFWENSLGRSRAFWQYMVSQVRSLFPDQFTGEDAVSLYRKANRVSRGFIRIDADEYTYNLHVILRFRLERMIINGEARVKDLPELWKSEFRELLGVVPGTLSEGVLQDIHWSLGDWGYFPTYALGNLYAAQFRKALLAEIPGLDDSVAAGNFAPVLNWLKEHIHSKGAMVSPGELIRNITGEELNYQYFIEYLKDKTRDLYAD